MEPGGDVATVTDEVLVVGMVLMLEVLMNHIGSDDEDMLGSNGGSFDGMTYGKTCGLIYIKYFEEKDGYGDGGSMMWSMKLKSRQRRCYNLT